MRRKQAMKGAALAVLLVSGPAAAQPDWEFLDAWCMDCHNFVDQAGGVAFDILPHDALAADAAVWENVVSKLRTGLMPPAGQPRPARVEQRGFVRALEERLDAELTATPHPGVEPLTRLNRSQYANAIRDLLDFDPSRSLDKLPSDTPAEGFDNMAAGLASSPTLIEGYLATAMRISREAVGDRTMVPTQVRYEAAGGGAASHVDGLPLGTRGGMLVRHNFPLDAEYEIHVAAGGGPALGGPGFCQPPAV